MTTRLPRRDTSTTPATPTAQRRPQPTRSRPTSGGRHIPALIREALAPGDASPRADLALSSDIARLHPRALRSCVYGLSEIARATAPSGAPARRPVRWIPESPRWLAWKGDPGGPKAHRPGASYLAAERARLRAHAIEDVPQDETLISGGGQVDISTPTRTSIWPSLGPAATPCAPSRHSRRCRGQAPQSLKQSITPREVAKPASTAI